MKRKKGVRVQCTSSMALPKLFCDGAPRYFGRCTRKEEEKGARGLKAHKGTCGSLDSQNRRHVPMNLT